MTNETLGFNIGFGTTIEIEPAPLKALKKISSAFELSDMELMSQNEKIHKRLAEESKIKGMLRDTNYMFRSMVVRQRLGIRTISQIETGLYR